MVASPTETIDAIKMAFLQNRLKIFVELVEGLAREQKHTLAADIYGDLLMAGVWDTIKMEVDRIRGQTVPSGPSDPYLILPRDPLRAVEFYKQAAGGNEDCEARDRARSKLAYLQKKGLAGFAKNSAVTYPSTKRLKTTLTEFLDKNAVSFKGGPFVPLPNVRPNIPDSKTFLFRRLALNMRNRCFLQMIIVELIATFGFVYSFWSNAALLFGFVTSGIFLPLLIFANINHYYGVLEGMPVCNCPVIVNAYELSVKHLPLDCRREGNPFETTPSYVRLSHFIKILFFWVYAIFAAVRVVLLIINLHGIMKWLGIMDAWDPKGVFFVSMPINFLVISLMLVFWDKKFAWPTFSGSEAGNQQTNLDDSRNSNNFLYLIISVLVSVLAEDRDCKNELDRVNNRVGLHLYVEELERENNQTL